MTAVQKIKAWARRIRAQVLALWFCSRHPDTPIIAKMLAAFVVAYALSPIDLIPDFIPVLGFLDEAILLPLCIYIALRLIPAHVMAEAEVAAEQWQAERRGRPRNFLAAVVIVAIWIALAWWSWQVFTAWQSTRP